MAERPFRTGAPSLIGPTGSADERIAQAHELTELCLCEGRGQGELRGLDLPRPGNGGRICNLAERRVPSGSSGTDCTGRRSGVTLVGSAAKQMALNMQFAAAVSSQLLSNQWAKRFALSHSCHCLLRVVDFFLLLSLARSRRLPWMGAASIVYSIQESRSSKPRPKTEPFPND